MEFHRITVSTPAGRSPRCFAHGLPGEALPLREVRPLQTSAFSSRVMDGTRTL
jgi:hypothetical protein